MNTPNQDIRYYQFHSGRWEHVEGGIISEMPVSLTVNGEVWLTFMCTPTQLEALAIGFLYNERVIETVDDIIEVRPCATGDNLDVWLHRSVETPREWRRTSGCTGGYTSTELNKLEIVGLNGFSLTPKDIVALVNKLFESQDLYRKVGGVHTSVLSDGREIVLMAEDIGRHNSLDKLAGLYLLEKIQLKNKVILTTGRISSEMLQKSARLGAGIVVSRTSPSSLSIQLAETYGITLIGYARRDRFNVYSHPERIMNIVPDAQKELQTGIPSIGD